MKLDLLNIENKKTDVQISETTFGKEFNETLVHQAVVTYLAGSRQGSHKQKTRSEVGGDRKSTRELQSHSDLVCRLLLEKKKTKHKLLNKLLKTQFNSPYLFLLFSNISTLI